MTPKKTIPAGMARKLAACMLVVLLASCGSNGEETSAADDRVAQRQLEMEEAQTNAVSPCQQFAPKFAVWFENRHRHNVDIPAGLDWTEARADVLSLIRELPEISDSELRVALRGLGSESVIEEGVAVIERCQELGVDVALPTIPPEVVAVREERAAREQERKQEAGSTVSVERREVERTWRNLSAADKAWMCEIYVKDPDAVVDAFMIVSEETVARPVVRGVFQSKCD